MTIQENKNLINTFFQNKITERMNSNSHEMSIHEKLKNFDFKLKIGIDPYV